MITSSSSSSLWGSKKNRRLEWRNRYDIKKIRPTEVESMAPGSSLTTTIPCSTNWATGGVFFVYASLYIYKRCLYASRITNIIEDSSLQTVWKHVTIYQWKLSLIADSILLESISFEGNASFHAGNCVKYVSTHVVVFYFTITENDRQRDVVVIMNHTRDIHQDWFSQQHWHTLYKP